MEEQRICILCPAGCHLKISGEKDDFKVEGNRCPRGAQYAYDEIYNPRRTVTAVAMTDAHCSCCCPVKSDSPVPKAMINELLEQIYASKVKLPVKCGQIMIENFNNTNINVVFTRTINSTKELMS
jgi:CxxC motif-containing protein